MDTLKHSLFQKELSVVEQISSILKEDGLSPEIVREHLAELLAQYKKLLRQTQQLVRLNDSHASKMHIVNSLLRQNSEMLEYSATHDALTNTLNKGAITEIIRNHLEIGDFVLILFDIDHFKNINDTYGHHIGDQVLTALANLVKDNIKHKDYFGRFGGEEFIILLSDISHSKCISMANNLLSIIEEAELANDGEARISITISIGLTEVKRNETFEDVYKRVDKLLYTAKQNGRNRIEYDLII